MPRLSDLFKFREDEEEKKKRRFFEPTENVRVRDVFRELVSPRAKRTGRKLLSGLDFIDEYGVKPTAEKIGRSRVARQAREYFEPKFIGAKPSGKAKIRMRDFLREAAKTGKDVQEEISRSGASVLLTYKGLLDLARGTGEGFEEISLAGKEPEKRAGRLLLGERPIKSIESRVKEAEPRVAAFGGKGKKLFQVGTVPYQVSGLIEKGSLPLAALGVGGMIALDFTGAGGKKTVVKQIAKMTDPADIAKVLRQLGAADDLILSYANKLARIKKPKEVTEALTILDRTMRETAPPAAKGLDPRAVPEVKPEDVISGKEARRRQRRPFRLTTPQAEETSRQLDEVATELENMRQALDTHPGRELRKYRATSGEFAGQLPEVLGKEVKGLGNARAKEFARRGDDMMAELGLRDTSEAQRAVDNYETMKAQYDSLLARHKEFKQASQRSAQVSGRVPRLLGKEEKFAAKAQAREAKAELRGVETGYKIGSATERAATYKATAARFRDQMSRTIEELNRRAELKELKGRILQREVENVKRAAIEYAKNNLPLRERGKLLSAIRNVKNRKGLARINERIDTLAEQAASRELRGQIVKELKKPKVKKVSGVPRGRLTAATQKQLDRTKEIVGMDRVEAERKILDTIRQAGDRPLTVEEIAENEMLSMAGIKQMNSTQLQAALDNIKSIKETGRTRRALAEFNRQSEYQRLRDAATSDVLGGRKIRAAEEGEPKKNILARAINTADNWLHGIDTLFEKLSTTRSTSQFSGPLHELAQRIHESRRVQNINMMSVTKAIQTRFNDIFGIDSHRQAIRILSKNRKPVRLGTVTKKDGTVIKDWQMSQNQMYKKWMEWQDESLRDTFEAMGWTDEMMARVEANMTPEVKRWAQWQLDEFYPKYGQTIAPVYETRFGTPWPGRKNYSPVRRGGVEPEEKTIFEDVEHFASLLPGSVKARVGSIKPLELVDGDSVLMHHIIEMEHFKAFEDSVRTLRAVFGDSRVKEAIKQIHGKDAIGTVNHLVDNVATDGRGTAHTIKALDKLRINFTRAKLGANPVVFLKQLSSVPAYITEMPKSSVTQFTKYQLDFWKNPIKNARLLMKSPMMQARYQLGAMERDIRLAMQSTEVKRMTSGKESFMDQLMMPVRLGDRGAILPGGWAVYKSNYDSMIKQGFPKELAHAQAIRKFEQATNRTQQAGTPEHLSRIQTSGGSIGRLFSMFLTAPQQYYRIVSRSLHGLRAGRGGQAANVKNIAIAWAVLPAVFQYIADGFEYRPKRQARAMIVGPLNGIPMLGNAFDTVARAVTGDDIFTGAATPGPLTTADDIANAIKRVTKEDVTTEDVWKAAEDLMIAAGDITGVPVEPVARPIAGIKGLATGEVSDVRRVLYSPYSLEQEPTDVETELKELRREYQEGKEPEPEELTVQDVIGNTITEGLASGMTADEIRSSAKKKAKAQLLKGKEIELTGEERKVKALPVTARAKFIDRRVEADPAILDEYVAKGILTEDVVAEMDLPPDQIVALMVQLGVQNGWSQVTIKNKIKKVFRKRSLSTE